MIYLFLIVTFYFSFQILRKTDIERFIWLLVGFIFIRDTPLISTSLTTHRILLFSVLISFLFRFETFKLNFKVFPLKYLLLILLISHFLVGLNDSRLTFYNAVYRSLYIYLETYFLIFVGFISVSDKQKFDNVISILFKIGIIISIYGLFVFIIKMNPYDSIMLQIDPDHYIDFTVSGASVRGVRLNSIMSESHIYGFLVASILIILISVISIKKLTKGMFLIIFLLFVNLFLSQSRASILSCILGIIVYISLGFNSDRKLKIVFACIFGFLILSFIPSVQTKISLIADTFSYNGGKTEGSSLAMREKQYLVSLYYFQRNPTYGNGFYYYHENLQNDKNVIYKDELYGMESYIFSLLVEQGIVQILCVSIFFIILLLYFFRNFKYSVYFSSLGISLTLCFIATAIMIGAVDRWFYCFPFIGMCIKLISLNKAFDIRFNHK